MNEAHARNERRQTENRSKKVWEAPKNEQGTKEGLKKNWRNAYKKTKIQEIFDDKRAFNLESGLT